MNARDLIDFIEAVTETGPQYLLAIRESIPPMGGHMQRDRLTEKMWILPDGQVVPLTNWHFEWLLKNGPLLKERFNLVLPFTRQDGEGPIRLWALNHGFTRVNYEYNQGRLTIEASARYFTKDLRDIVFMLCADNTDRIDNMTFSLLDPQGKVIKSRSAKLFSYDDHEKLEHLPLITDSHEDRQRLAIWKSYLREMAGNRNRQAVVMDKS